VIAPANTGRDNSSKIAVINTDHPKSEIFSKPILNKRKFNKVVIKFTAPSREEIPAKCNEKIAKSTEAPLCAKLLLKGG